MEILGCLVALLLFPFSLIGAIISPSDKSKKSSSKYSDEELMAYGLLDEEKELVKKGEYDPWQFEDDPDEMEEDDYYYDDF